MGGESCLVGSNPTLSVSPRRGATSCRGRCAAAGPDPQRSRASVAASRSVLGRLSTTRRSPRLRLDLLGTLASLHARSSCPDTSIDGRDLTNRDLSRRAAPSRSACSGVEPRPSAKRRDRATRRRLRRGVHLARSPWPPGDRSRRPPTERPRPTHALRAALSWSFADALRGGGSMTSASLRCRVSIAPEPLSPRSSGRIRFERAAAVERHGSGRPGRQLPRRRSRRVGTLLAPSSSSGST